LEAISRTYVNPSETVDASNFFVTHILGPILDRKNDLADDFHVLQPIECAGLFLRNIGLSGITISDADLADLTLENVDMSLAIINHTNLTGANFGEVFWGTSNRARTGWIYFSYLSYARFNRSRILGASAGLPRFVENTMIGTLFDYPDVYQISWVDPWGPDLQHANCMPLMRALECYNYHKSIYYGNDALTDSPENCPAVLQGPIIIESLSDEIDTPCEDWLAERLMRFNSKYLLPSLLKSENLVRPG
jgi:hypothetical protein